VFTRTQQLPASFAPPLTMALAVEAEGRNLSIHNTTDETICCLYDTNSGLTQWGNNVMGRATPPNGTQSGLKNANTLNQPKFDFRIGVQDGISTQQCCIGLCSVGDYTWN